MGYAESEGEEEAQANAGDASRRTHTTPRVRACEQHDDDAYAAGLSSFEGSVGEKRSGCVQAYLMSFTFETSHVLKSPLKEQASSNISLGGREEGCAESDGEE